MKCRRFKNRVSAFMDGRIEPSEREGFEAHRKECAGCAATLSSMERTEDLARKATRISPGPEFEEKVMGRVGSVPMDLEVPPTVAQPAENRFRFPFGIAAGILIGLTLGVTGHMALRAVFSSSSLGTGAPFVAEPPPPGGGELVDSGLLTPVIDSKELAEAKEKLSGFLGVSECLAGEIRGLPWLNSSEEAFFLNEIIKRLEIEKRIKEAEDARPKLSSVRPESAAVIGQLISDQQNIVKCLASPMAISPGIVREVQATADTVLDGIAETRCAFHMKRPFKAFMRIEPIRPSSLKLRLKKDVDVFVMSLEREVKGDLKGSLDICRVFPKVFPHSRLKQRMLAREARLWKQVGRDDQVIHILFNFDKVLGPEEVLTFGNETELKGLLKVVKGLTSRAKVDIRKKWFSLRVPPLQRPPSGFQSITMNGITIKIGPENEKKVSELYNQLKGMPWGRSMKTMMKSGENERRRKIQVTFKGGDGAAADPRILSLIKSLTAGLPSAPVPKEVTTIEFEGN